MKFTISDNGRRALADAEAGGIKLVIPKFRVGSYVNYQPDPTNDTNIRGTLLYEGSTSNFYIDAVGQIHYTCWMDDTIGDFLFGEIGLFLADGTMFALGSLENLQTKIKTSNITRGNIVSLDIIIAISGADATITAIVQNIAEAKLLSLGKLSQLLPPMSMPTNAYLIDETEDFGNNIIAYRRNNTQWFFPTHGRYVVANGVVNSMTPTTLTSDDLNITNADGSPISGNQPRGRYILQFLSGNLAGECRIVDSIVNGKATWAETFVGTGSSGDRFVLLQSTLSYYKGIGEIVPYHTQPISTIINLQQWLDNLNNRDNDLQNQINNINGRLAAHDNSINNLTNEVNARATIATTNNLQAQIDALRNTQGIGEAPANGALYLRQNNGWNGMIQFGSGTAYGRGNQLTDVTINWPISMGYPPRWIGVTSLTTGVSADGGNNPVHAVSYYNGTGCVVHIDVNDGGKRAYIVKPINIIITAIWG